MPRVRAVNCHSIARDIAIELVKIPYTDTAYEQVPEIFAKHVADVKDRDDRYEIFRLLDERPGLFTSSSGGYAYGTGHVLLRQCRNRPDPHGRRLFAVINREA